MPNAYMNCELQFLNIEHKNVFHVIITFIQLMIDLIFIMNELLEGTEIGHNICIIKYGLYLY